MNYLVNLDKKLLEITRSIGEEADNRNIRAYLVGGIVRDIMLDRKIFDLDIVVEADAIPFAWDLSRKLGAKATVYPNFGTAALKLGMQNVIDIATARKEKYLSPGALPIVSSSILKDDLFRRDFTINALAISINKDTWGNIVDEFGGVEDLKKKKLVVFHKKSFMDDPTRMLRLIRFEQRFSFDIERSTLKLFKTALKDKYYQSVKPQRYFFEFKKILKEDDPLSCFKRLNEFKMLDFIKKPFALNVQVLNKVHRGVMSLKKEEEFKGFDDWSKIYLMALLDGMDNKSFISFVEKISLSNDEKESLLQARKIKDIAKKISLKSIKKSQIYRALIQLKDDAIVYLFIRSNSNIVQKRIKDFFSKTRFIKLSIDGDVIKKKGLQSGEIIGKLLNDVFDAKIDGKIKNKRQEEILVKKLIDKIKKEKEKIKNKK